MNCKDRVIIAVKNMTFKHKPKSFFVYILLFFPTDFPDTHSICLQAVVPGIDVNEHCTQNDGYLNEYFVQRLQVTFEPRMMVT